MKYRKVQGWQVVEDWSYPTSIAPERIIRTEHVDLFCGMLTMKAGFCFEGSAPGPKWFLRLVGILGKKSKRGYCAHDAIYFLIRNGYLESIWKKSADALMLEIHTEDGMAHPAAKVVYKSVVKFAHFAIDPKNRIKVRSAP